MLKNTFIGETHCPVSTRFVSIVRATCCEQSYSQTLPWHSHLTRLLLAADFPVLCIHCGYDFLFFNSLNQGVSSVIEEKRNLAYAASVLFSHFSLKIGVLSAPPEFNGAGEAASVFHLLCRVLFHRKRKFVLEAHSLLNIRNLFTVEFGFWIAAEWGCCSSTNSFILKLSVLINIFYSDRNAKTEDGRQNMIFYERCYPIFWSTDGVVRFLYIAF